MPRAPRAVVGDVVYHAHNRANAGMRMFDSEDAYKLFETVLDEAVARFGTPVLAYCLLPDHWHLLVHPSADGELSRCLGWLSLTHTQRHHAVHRSAGSGHLYQGRFRSFPVQNDEHLQTVWRFIESHPVRAGLVARAEDWPWSSLRRRLLVGREPAPLPVDWTERLAQPLGADESAELAVCLQRGRPYGEPAWVAQTAARLGLAGTLRPRGRPPRR